MYSVPFCRLPVTASLGMMSGYSPAHRAASGISGTTLQLVGDFGKRGDLSSGEPEPRGWKSRSVTCLQQFAKRLFPMPGSCSTGSEQSAVFHTSTGVPTRSPCPPLPSRSQALSPERMPAWPQRGGHRAALTPRRIPRPVCSPEPGAGLAAVSPRCCLGTFMRGRPGPVPSCGSALPSPARPRSLGDAARAGQL